jgi:hypothetical protein
MAIFPGDVIIRSAIELGLEDLRKNTWIIEDIFSEFIENPFLSKKYGMKEIQRAKEFFLNNKIHIFLHHRMDKEEFPCVTVGVGSSSEDKSLATLADQSPFIQEFDPMDIGKPLSFVVPSFTPESYIASTGTLTLPTEHSIDYVSEGMILVDLNNGNGFVIKGKKAPNSLLITPNTELTGGKYAIAPKYQFYRARMERIISQETYTVGCHAHGDPSTLLFLYAIVKYSLLRYREGLLEYNNFQLSTISSSEMVQNNNFGEDQVYSRYITLTGQVEETWLKTPFRSIESVVTNVDQPISTEETGGDGVSTAVTDSPVGVNETSGIKIYSNEVTIQDSEESENKVWSTIDEE